MKNENLNNVNVLLPSLIVGYAELVLLKCCWHDRVTTHLIQLPGYHVHCSVEVDTLF